ncbi:MAG TPA: TonB-dependent receptor [Terracidiphilus sp.]|nr:TonB-dependent receptor [Terracidiphilus sp.]
MKFQRSAVARVPFVAALLAWIAVWAVAAMPALAAQGGNAGALHGVVTDPSGAVISGASVHLLNKASGFDRTTTTDASGQFGFSNVPFNPYRIEITAKGFAPIAQNTEVNSAVGTTLNLVMQIAGANMTVTVESEGPLVEDTSTYHTDIDRDLFNKVPLESVSSGLSSLVTETTPGVTADSNGLFHGLGDHASNSFSIDGQPVTDQQSKVFSNQLPTNAVQSLEVIEGAPPAQYGDKTSLVIVATTRSGQGITTPTGSVYGSYGSFGTANAGFNLSYGGANWGNFIEMDGLNTGRFLDPPEFTVMHARGNEQNAFDRIDYTITPADSIHLDLNYSRSWFQNPNAYDNLNVQNVPLAGVNNGASANPANADFAVVNVGNTDQRSQIKTFNIAPTYTRILSQNSVLNLNVYTRRDEYNYFPSPDPLADLGPPNLQTSSISQYRTLMNSGGKADYTWVHGHHNLVAGAEYNSTFLREHDSLGIVDNTYNSPCVDAVTGVSLYGYANPSQCNGVSNIANANYLPVLAPYDLTRGGSYYFWFGHADIKELSMYIEDQIKLGQWNLNLGVRGDKYNGLTAASQAEPRLGVAYSVKPTGTVLSVSYARTLETPFNENLVLSSEGCADRVLAPLLSCTPGVTGILQPGFRNEFHASIQQAFGKNLVASGEYIWKYTHNAFDFSVLGNTPITFPIDWHNSKIPGYALHLEVPGIHNFSAYLDASSVAARFFPPQVAGAGATVGQPGLPFRIDHDEKYNQTAHLQYTLPGGKGFNRFAGGIWGGFNWRYDSGQVAGSTPCYGVTDPNTPCTNSSTLLNGQPAIALVDNNIPAATNPVTGAPMAIPLTADQEFQAGLECNGQKATPGHPLPAVCPAGELSSSLLRIPAPNTGNNDRNPPRIAPRNLFDVDLGKNNLFHADKYKLDLDLTAVNVTNKYALYNFLSTFSGTHYVTPRTLTAKLTLNF